ncbi:hypothetical protein [Streptomyces sp. NPDC017673]|uniref:hypothetical protein n=1 Tax=unclassified Streptomyces TaxID=2593676 RepID=UPI00379176CC
MLRHLTDRAPRAWAGGVFPRTFTVDATARLVLGALPGLSRRGAHTGAGTLIMRGTPSND